MDAPHTMTIGNHSLNVGSSGDNQRASSESTQKGDQRESDPDPGNPEMFAGGRAIRGDEPAILEEVL